MTEDEFFADCHRGLHHGLWLTYVLGPMRTVIAALVVVGLAIGVVVLWPRSTADEPPVGGATTTTSTSTSAPADTTTTTDATTSTTVTPDDHVVETVEEAEAILQELWFGWFEGIYNEDEDRIREVVATEQMLEAARDAFGATFESPPTREGVELEIEILRADSDCLVTWGLLDVTAFRGPEATTESVQVMRWVDDAWRFATSWVNRDDLWEADCEAQLSPLQ
jgi:hypothetical protein